MKKKVFSNRYGTGNRYSFKDEKSRIFFLNFFKSLTNTGSTAPELNPEPDLADLSFRIYGSGSRRPILITDPPDQDPPHC
jgi:hypothetical protein